MSKWLSSKGFKGVRFREHPTRKVTGGRPDKYYTIRFKVNGVLHEEGIGWTSEGWNEAKAASQLAKLKESHRTGEGALTLAAARKIAEDEREAKILEAVSLKVLFSDYYLPQQKADGKATRSIERETALMNLWIAPEIGDLPLAEIKPAHLDKLKLSMKDKNSPRSIQYALAVVRQVFNFAASRGMYEGGNPVKLVKKPEFDNSRHAFLSKEQAQALLAELKGRSEQVYEIALMSILCGLRAGEIFSLTWGAVDLHHGILSILDPKNKKNRHVYLQSPLLEILKGKEPGRADDLVFPGRGGMRIVQISDSFNRAVDKLGFNEGVTDPRKKVVFHTLRHTHASWAVQDGVGLYTVQASLGHKGMEMVQRYSHLAPNAVEAASASCAKKLGL